jgi:hypothetical protein
MFASALKVSHDCLSILMAAGDQFPLPPSVASFAIDHPSQGRVLLLLATDRPLRCVQGLPYTGGELGALKGEITWAAVTAHTKARVKERRAERAAALAVRRGSIDGVSNKPIIIIFVDASVYFLS